MTTPGVSSWPYKKGKASREDMDLYGRGISKTKGTREGGVHSPLDHNKVAHYGTTQGNIEYKVPLVIYCILPNGNIR